MRPFVLMIAILGLAACRDQTVALPAAVPMTDEILGYYCQMDLSEHPGPKAQVHLDGMPHPIFFSQVRDGIAYQRMPEQSAIIAVVYVNDMGAPGATWDQPGSRNWIRADDAFYVLGSASTGGMGAPELVPFGNEADAEAFAASRGGRVLRLADIPDAEVLSPVAVVSEPSPARAGDEADYLKRLGALAPEGEG